MVRLQVSDMMDPIPGFSGISTRQLAKVFLLTLAVVILVGCVTSRSARSYYQVGEASWYGREYHGRLTASGERYNMRRVSAAHPTLPFGSAPKMLADHSSQAEKVKPLGAEKRPSG